MHLRNKNLALMLAASTCLWLASCAENPERIETVHGRPDKVEKEFPAPVVPPANNQTQQTMEPSYANSNKKVALILGPGTFKTFAHLGVIKELKKQNIPIDAVVGVEWGALVASLFAEHGQVHEAEWKLYKLDRVDLLSTSFFSRKREGKSTKAMEAFLSENLGTKDVGQTTLPFFCPSLSLARGAVTMLKSGPLSRVVESCLASPPLLTPQGDVVADLFSYDEIIRTLKAQGYNVIVFVNVLGDGNLFDKLDINEDYATAVLWDEARREVWRAKGLATDVIEVPTQGLALTDFESRKVLVTSGEAAGERAAHALAAKYGF